MKITSIEKIESFIIKTDEDDYYQYHRYGSDSWFVTMGESEEPVHYCEEIEKLFQEYIK